MSDDLDDLSAFEADAPAAAPLMGGNDNDTLKQIKRRTSPMGKVVIVLVLAAIGGAGFMAYRHMRASDTRMEVFEPIAAMEDPEQRNSALRAALEGAEFEDV